MPDAPPSRLVYDTLLVTSLNDVYKPAVIPRVTGLGLGAALLAELVLSAHLTVWSDKGVDLLIYDERYRPPEDSLALWLIEHLRAERTSLPVNDWLEFLAATDIYTKTAEHMVMVGLMVRTEYRTRWRQRTETAYEAADALIANAPLSRLRRYMSTSDNWIPVQDVFLTALTDAVGLSKPLYTQMPSSAREYAAKHRQALPAPLRALLGHLAAAVADTATTRGY